MFAADAFGLGRWEDAKSLSNRFEESLPAQRSSGAGGKKLEREGTYSVILFASSVQAAVELAEKTR